MGAWGPDIFENDTASDWAYGLEGKDDLSLVVGTIQGVLDHQGYLDADDACAALAACEVVARCHGRFGQTDAYTETIDAWITRVRPKPTAELRDQAVRVVDRVLGENSELAELWQDAGSDEWVACLGGLRERLQGA